MAINTVFITTTGASTFTVPADFASLVSVECIGGGGGGQNGGGGGGGAGGAYAISTAVTGLTASGSAFCSVGAGGAAGAAGGDTWFNAASSAAPTLTTQGALAKAGNGGGGTGSRSVGGLVSASVGTTKYDGGAGGLATSGSTSSGGGGGAAGPSGPGGSGGDNAQSPGKGGGGGGGNGGSFGANSSTTNGGNGGGGVAGTPTTNYSGSFNGTTDYLAVTNNAVMQLGTNNFTVEGWFYVSSIATQTNFFSIDSTGTNSFAGVRVLTNAAGSGVLSIQMSSNGTVADILNTTTSSTNPIPVASWFHLATVKNGTNISIYLNGVSILSSTIASTALYGGTVHSIGARQNVTYGLFLPGYISNFRLVNGSAVYTANFTPPTAPLTAITNTALLTCQSTSPFVDNSGNSLTITTGGTPTTSIVYPLNTVSGGATGATSVAAATTPTAGSSAGGGGGSSSIFGPSAGATGSYWTATAGGTAGSGGGGGGAGLNGSGVSGGGGGLYGAGGGGSRALGAQGIIVFTYNTAAAAANSGFFFCFG